MPETVVGDGGGGGGDVELEVIGPEFARAIQSRAKLEDADFRRDIGDHLVLVPAGGSVDGTIRHLIVGEDSSGRVVDVQGEAGPVIHIPSLRPNRDANVFSKNR